MFVWRKRASAVWLAANESKLREITGVRLAIIERANRKTAIAEIAGASRRELEKIRSCFGGTIEELPRDWLKELFSGARKSEPLRIGQRLAIVSSSNCRSTGKRLVIPAGAAFGTGEHATTAMTLRLLEQVTRGWEAERKWSMLDLGTGSGVLALAAKRFGARKVVAIDLDPVAIATAEQNAFANKNHGIDFRVANAIKFRSAQKFQIVSANLYDEVLIALLPNIARMLDKNGCAILSGILRVQEPAITCALRSTRLQTMVTRRRGKWLAMLVRQSRAESRDHEKVALKVSLWN